MYARMLSCMSLSKEDMKLRRIGQDGYGRVIETKKSEAVELEVMKTSFQKNVARGGDRKRDD